MLAPAAITLRRPSGEVDLILSKKDLSLSGGYYHSKAGMYSPPHRVCKSATTSPSGSTVPSPESTPNTSSHSLDTPSSSPHRRNWARRVSQLREDVDRISKRMKPSLKKSGLMGSVECLKSKLSSKKDYDPKKRTLRVEKINTSRKSKRGSKDDCCILSYDQPDHNFTNSLLMTNLEEGHFNAELSLDNLPMGNITIRICDYKLEIIVNLPHQDRHHKRSRPQYCGSLSIPIYVMPQTLEVSLNEGRNVLELRGMTKGYQYQHLSASTSDLNKVHKGHGSKVMSGLARLFSLGKDGETTDNMASLEVNNEPMRERAHTR